MFFSFLGLSSSCTRIFSEKSFSKTQDHTMQIKKDFPNTKSKAKINQSIFEMNFHSYGGKKQIVNNQNKTKHVHEMNTHTQFHLFKEKKIVPGTTNNKAIYWGYHGFAFSLTVFH